MTARKLVCLSCILAKLEARLVVRVVGELPLIQSTCVEDLPNGGRLALGWLVVVVNNNHHGSEAVALRLSL